MEVHRSFCHKILKERDNTGTCAMVLCISLCNYGSGLVFFWGGGGVIEFGAKAYFPEILRKSSRQNVQTQDSAVHEF